MTDQKHTKEPWIYKDGFIESENDSSEAVCQMFYNSNEHINAERIVECVNACAGIENPKDFIAQLTAVTKQRDELREALETAKARFHMLMIGMGPPDVDPKIGYIEIESILTKTKESV